MTHLTLLTGKFTRCHQTMTHLTLLTGKFTRCHQTMTHLTLLTGKFTRCHQTMTHLTLLIGKFTRCHQTMSACEDDVRLFFNRRNCLNPSQFAAAIAIRINRLPRHMSFTGHKCNCGYIYTSDDTNTINHVLKCDSSTSITHSTRHNMVRDTLANTARSFGLSTTIEPTCFTYEDGIKHRPDLLFHTQPYGLATDITLVEQEQDLLHSERVKNDTHAKACSTVNCIFIPFAMYTRGTTGTAAERLLRHILKAIEPSLHAAFMKEAVHAVSVAAARGRANALLSAAERRRI